MPRPAFEDLLPEGVREPAPPVRPPARNVGAITVTNRKIANRAAKRAKLDMRFDDDHSHKLTRSEIDNHADTMCAGQNCIPMAFTGMTCDVNGFHGSMDAMREIPVATVGTLWVHPITGEKFILVFHEALYFGDSMDHTLINPNQIRHFGFDVEDNPYRQRMGIDVDEALYIPFDITGTTVFFETCLPTSDELEHCTHIVLTSEDEWDPKSVALGQARLDSDSNWDDGMTRFIRHVETSRQAYINRDTAMYESDFILGAQADGMVEQEFAERMILSVNVVHSKQLCTVGMVRVANELVSEARHSKITPERIAKLFNVGLPKARQMLGTTTQRGVRQAVHPLTRRYRADHLGSTRTELKGRWSSRRASSP